LKTSQLKTHAAAHEYDHARGAPRVCVYIRMNVCVCMCVRVCVCVWSAVGGKVLRLKCESEPGCFFLLFLPEDSD